MERKEQSPPDGPPQAAKGEDDQSSEERRAMVALARILGAGPLVGGSLRLLEQLADYVQCPQEGVPHETAPAKPAATQPAAPAEEGSIETESKEVPVGESSPSGDPDVITQPHHSPHHATSSRSHIYCHQAFPPGYIQPLPPLPAEPPLRPSYPGC